MTWTNKDGLVQRFGVERSAQIQEGVSTRGVKNYLVVRVEDATDATKYPAAGGTSYPPDEDAPYIPANSLITNAWFVATASFTSGGGATLDIGLIQADGTVIDEDGLADGLTVAELTKSASAGGVALNGAYVCNGSGSTTTVRDGSGVVTQNSWIGITTDTSTFTGGAGTLIVEYVKVA